MKDSRDFVLNENLDVTVNFLPLGTFICPRGKRMLPPKTFKKERDRMLELEENTRLLKTLEEKLQDLGESL